MTIAVRYARLGSRNRTGSYVADAVVVSCTVGIILGAVFLTITRSGCRTIVSKCT